MKKIISKILLLIYLFIIILISFYIFLRSNNKNLHVFSASNLKSINNGTLVFAKKSKNIKVGDKIIYLNFYTNKNKVLEGTILSTEKDTYELTNNRFVSNTYLIGTIKDTVKIPLLGYPFSLLTSPSGYLVFALFPSFILFIYYLYSFIESKKNENN